jgi:catechol 2,3-dioxygenase-like lactoylglutathione lyase family enzyme
VPDSTTTVGTAFVPVRNPAAAADWYAAALGLEIGDVTAWSAQLHGGDGRTVLTLMGPASGIRADPGLPFATCSYLVDDLDAARDRLAAAGAAPSPVDGSPEVCLFVTARDPDGNTLLVVDR